MGIDWRDVGGFFKDWWPVLFGAGADLAIDLSVPDAPNMQYTPLDVDWSKYPELNLPEPSQLEVSQFGRAPQLRQAGPGEFQYNPALDPNSPEFDSIAYMQNLYRKTSPKSPDFNVVALPQYQKYQPASELPATEQQLLNKQFQPVFANLERQGKEASRRAVGAAAARGAYGAGSAQAAQMASRALTTQERTSLLGVKAQAALQRLDRWNETQRAEGQFAYSADIQNRLNEFNSKYQDYWNKVSLGRSEQARVDELNLKKATAEYDAARAKVMDEATFKERENVRQWEAEQTQKMLQYQATLKKFDSVSDMLANLVKIYMSEKNKNSFEDMLKNYFGDIPDGIMDQLKKLFGEGSEGKSWEDILNDWWKRKGGGDTGGDGGEDGGDGGEDGNRVWDWLGSIGSAIGTAAGAVAPYLPIVPFVYGVIHSILTPPRAWWKDLSDPQLAAAEASEIYEAYRSYQTEGAPKLDKPLTPEEYEQAMQSIREMSGLGPDDDFPGAPPSERDLRERLNQAWLEPITDEQWSQNIGLKVKPTWDRLNEHFGGKLGDPIKINWLWVIDQYGNMPDGSKNPEVALYRYIHDLTGEKPKVRKDFGLDPYADYKKGDPDVPEIPGEEAGQRLIDEGSEAFNVYLSENKISETDFANMMRFPPENAYSEEAKKQQKMFSSFADTVRPYYLRLKELNPSLPDLSTINFKDVIERYGKGDPIYSVRGDFLGNKYDVKNALNSWLQDLLTGGGQEQTQQSLMKPADGAEPPIPEPNTPEYDQWRRQNLDVLDPNSPNFDSIAFMQDLYRRTAKGV